MKHEHLARLSETDRVIVANASRRIWKVADLLTELGFVEESNELYRDLRWSVSVGDVEMVLTDAENLAARVRREVLA